MREPRRFESKSFVSEETGEACFKSVENDGNLKAHCNNVCSLPACYEEHYQVDLNYHKARFPNILEIDFKFKSFVVELAEEVPAYSWQELFANFGGCVGLMTGASILSLFELSIFFALIVFDYFEIYTKLTRRFPPRKRNEQ